MRSTPTAVASQHQIHPRHPHFQQLRVLRVRASCRAAHSPVALPVHPLQQAPSRHQGRPRPRLRRAPAVHLLRGTVRAGRAEHHEQAHTPAADSSVGSGGQAPISPPKSAAAAGAAATAAAAAAASRIDSPPSPAVCKRSIIAFTHVIFNCFAAGGTGICRISASALRSSKYHVFMKVRASSTLPARTSEEAFSTPPAFLDASRLPM